jgi:DNA-binding transcriptional ArsR family regulator
MAEVPGVGAIVASIKARIAQIEEQLRQHRDLSDELERLRDALGRLERGVGARVRGRTQAPRESASTTATPARTGTTKPAASTRQRAAAAPRGQTRARILEALKDGPKTAGDITEATGIPRGTASTTLNKLAKSGDVVKAERGYKLPDSQADTRADAPEASPGSG